MEPFINKDAEYRKWVEDHKEEGYVLNIPASTKRANGNLKFHRANCKPHILDHLDKNPTGPNFWKLCELEFDNLVKWAKKERPFTSEWPSPLLCNCIETQKQRKARPSALADELEEIIKNEPPVATTKQTLIEARVGQGAFRSDVLALWQNRCAVTGSQTLDAIRASHIKPWRDCTDTEHLDPQNGLPLIASLDALLDAGLISFEADMTMLISSQLDDSEQTLFGLHKGLRATKLPPRTIEFLNYHKKFVFRQ